MMTKRNNTGLILTAVFTAGMIASVYFLLHLQTDLSITSGAVSVAELPAVTPYIIRLQLVVISTLFIGLTGMYIIQRKRDRDVVYVEKSSDEKMSAELSSETDQSSTDTKVTADISRILKSQDERSLEKAFHKLCNAQEAVAGALYRISANSSNTLELAIPFSLSVNDAKRIEYAMGDGFVGQSAKDRKPIYVDKIPETHFRAVSGLGTAKPRYLAVIPLLRDEKLVGICELGSFREITDTDRQTLESSCQLLAGYMQGLNGKSKDEMPAS